MAQDLIALNQLQIGESGTIQAYQAQNDIQTRLRELGLVRGTKVMLKRLAPFGDPMELVVRGYNLSIRKKDAGDILIKKIS